MNTIERKTKVEDEIKLLSEADKEDERAEKEIGEKITGLHKKLDDFKNMAKKLATQKEEKIIPVLPLKEKIEQKREKELGLLETNYQNNIKIANELYGDKPTELAEDIKEKEKWYGEEQKKINDRYNAELENSGNTIKQPEPEKIEKPSSPENTNIEEIISKTLDDEFGERENREKIENIDIENQTLLLVDIEKAKEIFEKLPEENKQKIGWGLKTLGFKVEQKKNNFFATVFNNISKKLPEDKTTSRFCKNLEKGFIEDSEKAFKTAEKITNKEEKHGIQNTGLLFGNILRYGRMVSDFTGISFASPLRYVMMGGMALSRGARAATATRLENEDLIEKTRIQDADKAAEEAWKIYELAQKKEGTENVSANALKNAYLTEIPKDLQKRLEEPGTANNLIQNVLRRYLEYSIDKINSKIEKIEDDTTLSQKEKEIKIEIILNKQKEKLSDYDGMLTQTGTIDELAMAGRYAQTAGKVIVAAMTVETLYLSYEKISGLLSHILSGSDSSIPIHTDIGKNVIEETLKTKTGSQDTIKTIIEQKDSVGTKINDHEIKTEELKNKILEQFKTNDATIHKGEGIEHSFIRQIEYNPKLATELGFKGNINDVKALHEFAGREAHIIAIKEGYVDSAGHEVRITEADKVAYEIKVENGHVIVQEKTIVDGKLETSATHHEGDKFGEDINKYERVYTPIHHENISQNILEENYDSDGLPYNEQTEINAHTENLDIINQENPKTTEYVDTSKTQEQPVNNIDSNTETISPRSALSIGQERLSDIYTKNIEHLFPENTVGIWSDVRGLPANEVIGFKNPGRLTGLTNYLNQLEKVTGLKPKTGSLISSPESVYKYVNRAMEKALELGKLEEVNLIK